MKSQKKLVIEYLFEKHWDVDSGKFRRSVMTFQDVQEAIRHCNKVHGTDLSDRNPANFMKDIVRGQGASRNWPEPLTALRIGAVQTPGDGNVFEFVEFPAGHEEPFPDLYQPKSDTPRIKVQSVSLPRAAKGLGRSDEPWLIQTAVNLRVIETHFSVTSKLPVVEVTHLQMSVKLRHTEIDALFLATYRDHKATKHAIVTCEAKQWRERILDHQVLQQAKAAFQAAEEIDAEIVVPIALRAVRGVGFYVVEFEPIARNDAESVSSLTIASEAVYELLPRVAGI